MTDLQNTCIVGSGYMGGGIAQSLALSGCSVVIADVDEQTARQSLDRIVRETTEYEDLGLFSHGSTEIILSKLTAAASIETAVVGAHYISEVVTERIEVKKSVLNRISNAASSTAVIATNTSGLRIADLERFVDGPERFLGVHWMNPAPFVPGVEIIPGTQTDDHIVASVRRLMSRAGKVAITVKDTPGFVANRLQYALHKEASRMIEEGVVSPFELDQVVSNSFGFRLAFFGPFTIADMAGLDVYVDTYRSMEAAFGERFATPKSLLDAVRQGNYGVKHGQGLTGLDESMQQRIAEYRNRAYSSLSALKTEIGPVPRKVT